MEGGAGGGGPARGAAQPRQGGPQHEGRRRHQAVAEGLISQGEQLVHMGCRGQLLQRVNN